MKGRRKSGEPKLVSAVEAAEMLGVRQTNLRTLAGLPEPYDRSRAGTLWRESDIAEFKKKREAKAVAA
jgi:hypothetical protein